jgi:predicted amino acid-binding ACT domain protein
MSKERWNTTRHRLLAMQMICPLSRNHRAIQEIYQELRDSANEVGLKINVNKTQAMIQNRSKAKNKSQQQLNT